jgi:hypothetical protein
MRTASIAVLLLVASRSTALADTTVAIAVDTSTLNPKIATEIQDGIAAQVLAGLKENKLDPTPVNDSSVLAPAIVCVDIPCLQDIARVGYLGLIVRVQVLAKKSSRKGKMDFTIAMQAARARPELQSWSESSACPGCAPGAVKDVVFLLASAIGEHVSAETSKPSTPPPPVPVAPVAVTKPTPPPAVVVPPPPPAPEPEWSVPRYLSVTVLAGGVVLAGTGIYLLHLNGEGTCDLAPGKNHCPQKYQTQGLGTGLLVGGGLATLGGIVGLALLGPESSESGHVAVGFTGSSISISGAF